MMPKLRLRDECCSSVALEFTYDLENVFNQPEITHNLFGNVRGLTGVSKGRSTRSDRNREMFLAYQAGTAAEQLAQVFGLAILTVRSIIYHERHKCEIEAYLAKDSPSVGSYREAAGPLEIRENEDK